MRTAVASKPTVTPLVDRVEAYAEWVRRLRSGDPPPTLVEEPADPLAHLGRELQLLSDSISRKETELLRLCDLVRTVDRGILLDDVLANIFTAFKGLIPFERIGCAFLSPDGRTLVAYWAQSELGPIRIKTGYSQPMGGSSLEHVLASGEPRILNDLEAYLAAKPESAATRCIVAEGGRSSLTCPLHADDRPVGFLFFTSRQRDTYRNVHQTVFRQIAHQVGAVIEKARIYERLAGENRTLLEHNQHLEHLASTDGLTGVLTRRALDCALNAVWQKHGVTHQPFGVIMADIDHFKHVNDTYGHAVGDRVLADVGSRLRAEMRAVDTCGRYGGEEFLLIIRGTTEAQLLDTAERLRVSLEERPVSVSVEVPVTASFGVAHSAVASGSVEALVALADAALYEAKAAGRNRSVVGRPAMRAIAATRSRTAAMSRHATKVDRAS